MSTELFFTKPVSGAFTGSVEGDRVGSVSFFGSASFAPQSDFAQDAATATSASHAAQADNAQTADFATAATSASHAVQADNAQTADAATSASHAVQADNAKTADFATAATSASHAVQADNAQTADLATTASHAVDFDGDVAAEQVQPGTFQTGDFTFNGDITVNGTASIQHLSVVTTSQIFESGSSIFGDTLDDTHQFTGSVLVTGSVEADTFVGDGAGITGVVSASHAVNADTASFAVDAGTAATASFVTASNIQGTVESASFAVTAAFASNVEDAVSTSLAEKAKVAPMNVNLNSFFGAEAKLLVPVAVTEQDDGQRTLASLLGYTQARVIVRVTEAPSGSSEDGPAGVLAVEGSTDDASFAFLCGGSAGAGDGSPSASLSGTVGSALTSVSPWCDITGTLAVEDVFLRWVTYSGSDQGGQFRPRVGSINLQVR